MRPIKLSPQRAASGVAAIITGIDNIESELETLESKIRLLQSSWDGEAREAFTRANREWDESVNVLHKMARDASNIATGSVARFADFDRRRASAWGK